MLPVCFRAPKTAILYIRTFSGDQSAFTAKMQEFMLRKFCEEKKIQVIDTIRTHVDEAESIRFLTSYFETIQSPVDILLAVRLIRYSSLLYDLYGVCDLYLTRGIELYSLEYGDAIRHHIPVCYNPYSGRKRKIKE